MKKQHSRYHMTSKSLKRRLVDLRIPHIAEATDFTRIEHKKTKYNARDKTRCEKQRKSKPSKDTNTKDQTADKAKAKAKTKASVSANTTLRPKRGMRTMKEENIQRPTHLYMHQNYGNNIQTNNAEGNPVWDRCPRGQSQGHA